MKNFSPLISDSFTNCCQVTQEEDAELNDAFENLKKNIIKKSEGSLDLEEVKKLFSPIIDSTLKLSKVKTLDDIFYLLDYRAELDAKNICTLEYLANLLGNEEIWKLIRGYKKLYIDFDDNAGKCEICGVDNFIALPLTKPDKKISENKNNDDLECAFENIARNIGRNWRVLASELKVPECYVDKVRAKYPSDFYLQALNILQIWRAYYQDAATMDVLKTALEARLCKKKGVGLHMLIPVIHIEVK